MVQSSKGTKEYKIEGISLPAYFLCPSRNILYMQRRIYINVYIYHHKYVLYMYVLTLAQTQTLLCMLFFFPLMYLGFLYINIHLFVYFQPDVNEEKEDILESFTKPLQSLYKMLSCAEQKYFLPFNKMGVTRMFHLLDQSCSVVRKCELDM